MPETSGRVLTGWCGDEECPGAHWYLILGATAMAWCLPLARRLELAAEIAPARTPSEPTATDQEASHE